MLLPIETKSPVTPPRSLLDKQADLVVVYPDNGEHVSAHKAYHLVVFDAYPARVGSGYYAGFLTGAPEQIVIVRAPRTPQFVLAFYEQVGHLDNPHLCAFDVIFDKTLVVDEDEAEAAAHYQIETDLFQCRVGADASIKAGVVSVGRLPMPRQPMLDLEKVCRSMERKQRPPGGEHLAVATAVTPIAGKLQGPSVAEIWLGDSDSEIEAMFSHFEFPMEIGADAHDRPLALPGFSHLRVPQVVVDLSRFGDRAKALARCFVFSRRRFRATDTELVYGGRVLVQDGRHLLVHQWPDACPRDYLGVAFFAERSRHGEAADDIGGRPYRLRVYDAVGDQFGRPRYIDVGDDQGVTVSYLELSLGFYQGVTAQVSEAVSAAVKGNATDLGAGSWRWADAASAVRSAGVDLQEAEAYSAPLLYSYVCLLDRVVNKPALGQRLVDVGIHWQSFRAYLQAADALVVP